MGEDKVKEELESLLEGLDVKYSLLASGEARVTYDVVDLLGEKYSVWYDITKQLYGFNLLQGGYKTCDTPESLVEVFGNYIKYNTFLARAGVIARRFEIDAGVNLVYESFIGTDSVYKSKYRVLDSKDYDDSDSLEVVISLEDITYTAKLIRDVDSKKKVVRSYDYHLDDDGETVFKLFNADVFVENLFSREYKGQLVRNDKLNFTYTLGEDSIDFDIVIDTLESRAWIGISSPVKLDRMEFKDYDLDFYLEFAVEQKIKQDTTVDIDGVEVTYDEEATNVSEMELIAIEEDITEVSDTEEQEPVSKDDSSNGVSEEQVIEETVEDTTDNIEKSTSGVKVDYVYRVYDTNNKLQKLYFRGDDLVSISVDVAETYLSRGILSTLGMKEVMKVNKFGLCLTQIESTLKCLANDISNNDSLCEKYFDALFEF